MARHPPNPDAPRLPAVILAGGLGTRMGGVDKALLRLGNRPLAARVLDRLSPVCGPLAINANGDPARFGFLGTPVLPDPVPAGQGPLAGILAAMDWAGGLGASHVVTAAADTPFLPADLAPRLWAARGAAGIAVAASPDPEGRIRRHPTAGLWPVALASDLRAALDAGERKLGLWADRHAAGVGVFEAGQGDPFFNINTPADLSAAERAIAGDAA